MLEIKIIIAAFKQQELREVYHSKQTQGAIREDYS
jgi:hypothetical protein